MVKLFVGKLSRTSRGFVPFVSGRSKAGCRVREVSAGDPLLGHATGVATRGHGGMVHGEIGSLRSRKGYGKGRGGQLDEDEDDDDDDDDGKEEDLAEQQWTGRKIPIQ